MSNAIESSLNETRVFPPSDEIVANAEISGLDAYRKLAQQAEQDPDGFWGDLARQHLQWTKPFSQVLDESDAPFYRWFGDGELNVSANCLDVHVQAGRGDKTAIIFEADDGQVQRISYAELHQRVCRFANGIRALGYKQGERAILYLPMSIEAVVAMQACARLGITHSVVFGGFSAKSLQERIVDVGATLVITADEQVRGGKTIPLKPAVEEAFGMGGCDAVRHVIVYRRTGGKVAWNDKRDLWMHDVEAGQPDQCEPVAVNAEHPLFILYTSGSTGKPKGVQHSSAGYLLWALLTMKWTFDAKPDDVYWCTADVGWVTGHSYLVYGPLSCGASVLLYEGAPNFPDWGRFWQIVERHGVSILYTAPTAIRAFIRAGDEWPKRYDLSSLRLLGSVGEPINPEAWIWYSNVIGGKRCPIVDTWWQTETGAIMLTTLPGACYTKPGSTGLPLFGIDIAVVKDRGDECKANEGGKLVVRRPWPSMARTLWGDDERYRKTYWDVIPGVYFTGDGARRDEDGYFWVVGRIDDVLNVAGHRIGTAEIESALVSHPAVAEAAAVGRPDDLKGQALVVFVTLKAGQAAGKDLKAKLTEHIDKEIGKFARPDQIRFTDSLPKTRSGKIMRRLLKEVAAGAAETKGDTSTLEDLSVLAKLRADEE